MLHSWHLLSSLPLLNARAPQSRAGPPLSGDASPQWEHTQGLGTNVVSPLWKAVWEFLKKLNVERPQNPATHEN